MTASPQEASGITMRTIASGGAVRSPYPRGASTRPMPSPCRDRRGGRGISRQSGELSRFRLAVTHEGAQADFDWFLEHALSRFGTYQDALVDDDRWVFHSLISMYLNCGLLEPLPVCQAVEARYRAGDCSLAAAEGFIRQILGWREYVRGVYWLLMPEYAERNTFSAERPLPEWFWNAETDLRCLSRAIGQSLDDGMPTTFSG
jgi:deoxyribodipyrimidine photolyase-related protein